MSLNLRDLLVAPMVTIDQALSTPAAWAEALNPFPMPVLAKTAYEMEDWREMGDLVDAHQMADALESDPLMASKVFALIGTQLRGSERTHPETITSALLLMGIPPFFSTFGPQRSIDEFLTEGTQQHRGVHRALARAQLAARMALSFSAHRVDQDAHVLFHAAMLHTCVELFVWLQAPSLAARMSELRRAQPTRRSADIQQEVLHFDMQTIAAAWFRHWNMPSTIAGLLGLAEHSDRLQVRTMQIALSVSRHVFNGWDDPALPDDLQAISDLLQISPAAARNLVMNVTSSE